ncbi:hypothetical protein Tco_0679171 [Tanacetum coccineum]|uniref:Uncharacterized protein n=1 Tax=Tanacetum coccineum TaxID=301880 RepID=A0ABQ4XH76_9ASTR
MRRPFGDAMDGTYLRLRLHDICSWISSVPFLRPRCPRSLLRTSLLFCGACVIVLGVQIGGTIMRRPFVQAAVDHRDCQLSGRWMRRSLCSGSTSSASSFGCGFLSAGPYDGANLLIQKLDDP